MQLFLIVILKNYNSSNILNKVFEQYSLIRVKRFPYWRHFKDYFRRYSVVFFKNCNSMSSKIIYLVTFYETFSNSNHRDE